MPQPRDNSGRFVPLGCPVCDNGKLEFVEEKWLGDPNAERGFFFQGWRCHGLLDPENVSAELQPCWFTHKDGESYYLREGRVPVGGEASLDRARAVVGG